ncbi:MAG: ykoU [Betaproteobacteria bacterium]|nr:ykoU [Betaproteobacteria bacterium]
MALELYNKKRDFGITPEPKGKVVRNQGKALVYVIQKHRASHMHYDFRLELDGVLLSWAVPKGPSYDPAVKRLAMHVEDHPIEYGDFEGTIPPKQYGAGTVLLWDRGVWTPKGDPAADYKKGRLKFELDGEKLHGGWMLVRSHGGKYDKDKAWFLIKERDAHARPEAEGAVVDDEPNSVASGRSLEEIAADPDRVWHSNKSVAENVKTGAVKKQQPKFDAAALKGARKAPFPDFIEPELATLVKEAPAGAEWVHEMKLDGYRMLCRIENGQVQMISRNGKDWTANFLSIARCVARLPVDTAWLDGEVVVMEADGRTSFQALQNALSADHAGKLHYFAFDLMYLNGYDLRGAPLLERKRVLESLLAGAPSALRLSTHIEGSGAEFFRQACSLKLEGMISKRAQSAYLGGRGRDWLKVKCTMRQELVIGGYTDPEGARVGFGALLLGVYEADGSLRYSGKVGTGFNDATLKAMHKQLQALEVKQPAFSNPPRGYEAKGAHWIRPELVAEVEFTEWTNDGTLRHPSFQGLREDKKASDVVRERAAPTDEIAEEPAPSKAKKTKASASAKAAKTSARAQTTAAPEKPSTSRAKKRAPSTPAAPPDKSENNSVAGIKLSNPDKLLYPEAGVTKRDLALFYQTIADWILPQLRDRPLTLVRCPNGWEKQCFFQKHPDAKVDPLIERVTVQESNGPTLYMMANSLPALVALVQIGALELHPFGSSAPKLTCPDRLVFDFDPADGISWETLVEGVHLLKTLLEELGLRTFIKTTGGKGLHVVLPIKPSFGWDETKQFTKSIAELLVRSFPDRFTATVSKSKRTGKIFIDYLRNADGATAIAAYSLRARRNAPVATPIAWEELATEVREDYFNIRNVPDRLKTMKKDPWADFFDVKQSITKAMMKKVGAA